VLGVASVAAFEPGASFVAVEVTFAGPFAGSSDGPERQIVAGVEVEPFVVVELAATGMERVNRGWQLVAFGSGAGCASSASTGSAHVVRSWPD
jgi:hypothetical protein